MAVAPATVTGVDLVGREARFPRLVALILDSIFISVITLIATNVYGVTVVTSGSPVPTNGFASWSAATTIPGIWTVVIWVAYYTLFEAMFSATPGKALTGLRVVSADGSRLTVRSIVIRNVVRLVDALPFLYAIGGIAVLASLRSQRLGDMAAHTTVVMRRRMIDLSIARSSGRSASFALMAGIAAALVFTAFFDYFGRPALVIQSAYNQNQLLPGSNIVSYTLGAPARTLTTVTYPVTAETQTGKCTGSIVLSWQGLFGWEINGASLACPPAS